MKRQERITVNFRALSASIGLSFVLLALLVWVAPSWMLYPSWKLAEETSASIVTKYRELTAGPWIFETSELSVVYPSQARINDTIFVRVGMDQRYLIVNEPASPFGYDDTLPRTEGLSSLQRVISFSLHGAAFEIDPIDRVFSAGESLPISFSWTVSAEKTGNHALVLDWSRNILNVGPNFLDVDLNGVKLELHDNAGELPLPIQVNTKWGISQFWTDIISYSLAFVGFLLMLPFLPAAWGFVRRQVA